jgi:hypothetical protein
VIENNKVQKNVAVIFSGKNGTVLFLWVPKPILKNSGYLMRFSLKG